MQNTGNDKSIEIVPYRGEASRLSARVEKAKTDDGELNVLIADYLPFIKSLVSTYVQNAQRYDRSSLVSIATEAFWLAVKAYSKDKGAFICFAAVVIKRRLLNEVAAQNVKTGREVDFSALSSFDNEGNEALFDVPDGRTPWDNPLKWEIEAIKTESLAYGINFFKLNNYSPKAEKTKLACFSAVKHLIHDGSLLQSFRRKSTLPLKELCEATGIERKTLERHRQYILVVALISTDDYPYLQEWLALRKYGVLP